MAKVSDPRSLYARLICFLHPEKRTFSAAVVREIARFRAPLQVYDTLPKRRAVDARGFPKTNMEQRALPLPRRAIKDAHRKREISPIIAARGRDVPAWRSYRNEIEMILLRFTCFICQCHFPARI